jgi:hypothetical protein
MTINRVNPFSCDNVLGHISYACNTRENNSIEELYILVSQGFTLFIVIVTRERIYSIYCHGHKRKDLLYLLSWSQEKGFTLFLSLVTMTINKVNPFSCDHDNK